MTAPTTSRRARPRTALVTASAVAIVVVLLVVVLATRPPASERVDNSPLVGRQAPALAGPLVSGGEGRADLRDGRGGFVLVNFFATWCVPCIQEHDDLARFAAAHESDGTATVLSVVYGDDPATVRRFFERNGGTWPVVTDDDGSIATSWGVAKVPESYLVAPDGTIVSKITGGVKQSTLESLLVRAGG